MRTSIMICLTIFLFSQGFSQTREKEVKYLDEQFKAGKYTQEQYKALGLQWSKTLIDIGGYPTLPFDEDLQVIRFHFVKSFPCDKAAIYKRIKEWAAISFGSVNDVLHYEDFESGKIILKGYFDIPYLEDIKGWFSEKETINSAKCSHTYIFTIKDKKIKVDIIDLVYEFKYYTFTYTTPLTLSRNIDSLYPITKDNSLQWKSKLTVLKNTELRINSLVSTLDQYISMFESDYEF